ncbi:unnamed protein product [Closterium sp. NIES-53]
MDAEMASRKSTGTYVDEAPPPGANIVSGMWIFRVKRPPGSPPVFKARYVARGFSQRQGPRSSCIHGHLKDLRLEHRTKQIALRYFLARELQQRGQLRLAYVASQANTADVFTKALPPGDHQRFCTMLACFALLDWSCDLLFSPTLLMGARYVARGFSQRQGVDYFQTFSPTPKMTTLRVLLHVAAQRDYELHSLDFSTAFLQGSLHEEIWLRRPPGFTGSFPPGTQWSLRRPVYGLRQTPQSSGPYPELVGCLMYLMTCTRPDLAYPLSILARYVAPGRHRPEHMAAAKRVLRYLCSTSGLGLVLGGRRPVVLTGHADASWADDQATQRSSQGYTFSLGSGSVSWRSTRSSSVLGSSCEAEIYARAMAAQELRWLTYLLTDLGEQPRSPPVLYVDNKVMLAMCREHRLEHRTKHIALRYFLARELQ